MKLYIELYASLMRHLPPGKDRFRREIKGENEQNLQGIIDRFNITPEEAHIVLVNGHFVCDVDREKHLLKEGDVVSIWPPVAGG